MDRVVCNSLVIKDVASELGLSPKEVQEIVACQSEFTKHIIETGSFDNVRWPYLGIFKSKTKEIQIINYIKGMTPEQAEDFKKAVRTGRIKLQPEIKKGKKDDTN